MFGEFFIFFLFLKELFDAYKLFWFFKEERF